MAIYYFIETEVAHRRSELEREIVTAAQVAQTHSEPRRTHWSHLPHWALSTLRGRFLLRVLGSLGRNAATQRARTRQGGCAAVA